MRVNVKRPVLAKFQSSVGRGKWFGRPCLGTMTRSASVVWRLKLRTRMLFPGVAHGGEWHMISRRRFRARLLEILGCRVAPPAMEIHASRPKA